MKSFKLLASMPVLFGVLGGAAQTSPDTQQARANVLQSRYMTSVKVELTTKLDTKNAVAGQPLMAKTLADVSLADGTAIPAGTRLLGSVVEVRGMSGDRTGAIVTVTFDRAELKGAKTLEVRSMIRAISSPGGARAPAVDAARRTPDPIMGADESGLGGAGMGGAGIGGAGIGGTGYPGGGVGGPGVGGPGYPGGGNVGGVGTGGNRGTRGRQAPIPTTLPPPEQGPPPVRATAEGGESVTQVPRPTGMPGVMLLTNPAKSDSGTLTEFGQNIRLDSGTQITLGVIAR